MRQQDLSPLGRRMTILIGLSVIGAMAFGLAISFYRNILFEETLQELADENRSLRTQIDDGLGELAYYRSRQYREKYAKENLGKLNPGEKVLILQDRELSALPTEEENRSWREEHEAAFRQQLEAIPVLEHWRLYLFDAKGLEQLRASL